MSDIAVPTFTQRNPAFLASTYVPDPPPDGVTVNSGGTNVNGVIFMVVSVIGLILATMFTFVRIYTKAYLTRALGWDDYTCVLAWITAFIWTGANFQMALLAMGLYDWNVRLTYGQLEIYFHDALIVNSVYFFTVCLVKVSLMLLYLRTFSTKRIFRRTLQALIVILVVSHLLTWILYWTSTTPLSCNWIEFATDEEYYASCHENLDIKPCLIALNALTIVMDIVILVMPLPHVWRLQMGKRQKIAILFIILAGLTVTIASTLRLVYLVRRFYVSDDDDTNWITEFQVNLISTVEIDVAIICTCLPTLPAFLKRFAPGILKLASSGGSRVAYDSRNNKRATLPQPSNHHLHPSKNKLDRRWETESHEEVLVGGTYVELGEDGKSDQSYAMTSNLVNARSP